MAIVVKPCQGFMRVALSGFYKGSCICWFCDGKVIGLLSPYGITVVYMPGTSIGFYVSAVSSSCLTTKEQEHCGSRVTLRLGSRQC